MACDWHDRWFRRFDWEWVSQSLAEIQLCIVLPRGDDAPFRVFFSLGISHSRSGGEWSFMRLIRFQSNRRPHLAISYSFGSIRSTHARQPTPMDPVPWTIHFFPVLNGVIRIPFRQFNFLFVRLLYSPGILRMSMMVPSNPASARRGAVTE